MTSKKQRVGAAYVIEPKERDIILAAIRGRSPGQEAIEAVKALEEYLRDGPAEPPPVALSECCHATILYDGWLDSNGEAASGTMDHSECSNCYAEEPEVWDGKTLPWPRSRRPEGVDLPEGVEEPPAHVVSIVLHKQKRAKHPVWLADTMMDNGEEMQAPTPYLVGMDVQTVVRQMAKLNPKARIGVRSEDLGIAGPEKIVWFDTKKLLEADND